MYHKNKIILKFLFVGLFYYFCSHQQIILNMKKLLENKSVYDVVDQPEDMFESILKENLT